MDRSATVAMPYHGFETTVYTLLLGPGEERLYVDAKILSQIPCVVGNKETGDLELDADVLYHMPNCDPKAHAILFAFIRDGALPVWDSEVKETADLESIESQVRDYTKAYDAALDYELEAAQNAILDRMSLLLREQDRNGVVVRIDLSLGEWFHGSKMYELLCRRFAYFMQQRAQDLPDSSFQSESDLLAETTGRFDRDTLLSLMTHLLKPIEENPVETASKNPCLYHVHIDTETCGKPISEELGDAKSLPIREIIDHIEMAETADEGNGGEKNPSLPGDEIVSFCQTETQSNELHTETSTLPSQAALTWAAHLAQGRSRQSDNQEVATSSFAGDCAESSLPSVKETIGKTASKESFGGLKHNLDGEDESNCSFTDIPTPPSSTNSAESQSSVQVPRTATVHSEEQYNKHLPTTTQRFSYCTDTDWAVHYGCRPADLPVTGQSMHMERESASRDQNEGPEVKCAWEEFSEDESEGW